MTSNVIVAGARTPGATLRSYDARIFGFTTSEEIEPVEITSL